MDSLIPFFQHFLHHFISCGCRVVEGAGLSLQKFAGQLMGLQVFAPEPDAAIDFGIVMLCADAADAAMAELAQMIEDADNVCIGEEAN